eukprot:Nk52_evm43s96 gene=Nk52_evmTU43s96
MSFHTSSQREHFIFKSPEEIHQLRVKANQRSRNRIAKASASAAAPSAGNPPDVSSSSSMFPSVLDKNDDSVFLTTEEELVLWKRFALKLQEICSVFNPPFPPEVVGTATAYFKRFYLRNTAMDYDLLNVMLSCLYMACKVEEVFVSIHDFCSPFGKNAAKSEEAILENESLVLEKMDFYIMVHNPYRCLRGFLIDVQGKLKMKAAGGSGGKGSGRRTSGRRSSSAGEGDADDYNSKNSGVIAELSKMSREDFEKIRKTCMGELHASLTTDLMLLYSPPQIALATISLHIDIGWYVDVLFEGYDAMDVKKEAGPASGEKTEVKKEKKTKEEMKNEFLSTIESIGKVLKDEVVSGASLQVDNAMVKVIDKKLKRLSPTSNQLRKEKELKKKQESLKRKRSAEIERKEREAKEFKQLMGIDESDARLTDGGGTDAVAGGRKGSGRERELGLAEHVSKKIKSEHGAMDVGADGDVKGEAESNPHHEEHTITHNVNIDTDNDSMCASSQNNTPLTTIPSSPVNGNNTTTNKSNLSTTSAAQETPTAGDRNTKVVLDGTGNGGDMNEPETFIRRSSRRASRSNSVKYT